jgi:hypothetical protein
MKILAQSLLTNSTHKHTPHPHAFGGSLGYDSTEEKVLILSFGIMFLLVSARFRLDERVEFRFFTFQRLQWSPNESNPTSVSILVLVCTRQALRSEKGRA